MFVRIAISASLTLLSSSSAVAETIHVPEDYSTIQAAIDAAVDGDEIVVAPGIYGEAIDFSGKAIHVRSLGGRDATTIDVTGMETTAVTIVSGEGSDSILEGFKITGGESPLGGGMHILESSPTITDCFFLANSGRWGGGIYNSGGSPEIVGVEFRNNYAIYGASICSRDPGDPTITSCSFIGNSAEYWGGGIFNGYGSNATITDCVFDSNVAPEEAGGAIMSEIATSTIRGCVFNANSALNGGAIHIRTRASTLIVDCRFENNNANQFGGAIDASRADLCVVERCFFQNNTANSRGGAINNEDNDTRVNWCIMRENRALWGGAVYANSQVDNIQMDNCIIVGNVAQAGAGLYVSSGNPGAVLRNSTILGNLAMEPGGGVRSRRGTDLTIHNSIIWHNRPDALHIEESVEVHVAYSNINGGYSGEGNIDADPRFYRTPSPGEDGEWGTDDDDFGDPRLRVTSPSIDAGDNGAVPEGVDVDLDGAPRFVDNPDSEDTGRCEAPCAQALIDMGAYEYQVREADPPTELRASDGDFPEHVALRWEASLYGVDYRLFRNVVDDPAGAAPITDWLPESEFDDDTAEPGVEYWYWLRSRNAMGESGLSEGETGWRWAGPPPAPTDLDATDGGYTDRVVLSWSAAHTATAYRVYRGVDEDPDRAEMISDWIQDTSHEDFSGEPLVEYWYWVTARNVNGESAYSEGDLGFRWGGPPPPPEVRASDGDPDIAVIVEWEPARFADDYRVYRHTENDPEGSSPISDWRTNRRFVDVDVLPGQVYWYWVTARNVHGEGDWGEGDSGYTRCIPDPEWVCDGDVSGDGQVNPVDLGILQANFGNDDPQALCNYDLDCDRQINPVDAGIVQSLFGTCRSPRTGCP